MNFPEDAEFVCVYGWDDTLYAKALDWVDDQRRAAFVVEEEKASQDPRISIYVLESPIQIETIAKKIAWSAVLRKMAFIGGPSFQEKVEKFHLAAGLILSEAADWGEAAFRNAYANQKPHRRGMELKGAFEGIPAIIVGAGPSLEKNGHLLREFESRALIFAGGSALNALNVEPHFAASIDAAAPYQQFKGHPFSETPFCYQSRMNAENFSLVHGERILFPDSSSKALNWLANEEEFDGGWTVGNFLTAIAIHMGCDPIILVGMDLCYTGNRKYAKIETSLPDGLVQAGDFLTQADWLMAAQWTEERTERILNATEGGLLKLPRIKLSEALEICQKERDLRKLVHEKIQKLPLHESSKRWHEWAESLKRLKVVIDEQEIVYQMLLEPLWQIWKPVFERENQKIELHRALFFQQVLEEHGSVILSER